MNHNNIWSHRLPNPSVNWGNDFFILPDENKPVSASSSIAYHNNMPTSTINFASSSNSDLMNFRTSNLEVSLDPYLNYSSMRRSNLIPQIYPHNASYNRHDNRGSTSAENTGCYKRLCFKRKSSGHPMALDVPNSNHYYNLRNSNGLSVSSDQHMSNHNLVSHTWSHSSTNMLSGYPSNCPSTIGERSDSHRNVRSRHVHALGPHASGSLPPHFRPIASTSDHLSHSIFPSQGLLHHEINQPIGSSGSNVMMEIADGYLSNLGTTRNTGATRNTGTTRNMGTAVPTAPVIPTQDSINSIQRPDPYISSRYTAVYDVLPRWRRHRFGQNDERYGRMRSAYGSLSYRINTAADDGNAHGRLDDENAAMLERSVFYDPPAMFDQHRNMRMDVDNMSYEELIALGERIGTVSTGLTDDDISRCLITIIYASDCNQDSEEGSCVICLDEYKNGQSIGRLNCRHEFHVSCIKKWLLIKNACPVCKSAAMGEKVKGKQVVLM